MVSWNGKTNRTFLLCSFIFSRKSDEDIGVWECVFVFKSFIIQIIFQHILMLAWYIHFRLEFYSKVACQWSLMLITILEHIWKKKKKKKQLLLLYKMTSCYAAWVCFPYSHSMQSVLSLPRNMKYCTAQASWQQLPYLPSKDHFCASTVLATAFS